MLFGVNCRRGQQPKTFTSNESVESAGVPGASRDIGRVELRYLGMSSLDLKGVVSAAHSRLVPTSCALL